MGGIRIRLMESNFDQGVNRVIYPRLEEIEEALRTLANRPGRIDLWDERDNGCVVMVSGSPGAYGLDIMKDESNAAMLVAKNCEDPTVVEVFGEEYRSNQVVSDIDELLPIVRAFLDTGEFIETASMKWEHRQMW